MKGIKEIDGTICVSTSLLCKMLDVTPPTLMKWANKGCPKAKHGWWPLKEVIEWRGLAGDNESRSLMQRKLAADVAYKEAQRELTKLKNDITVGRFLDTEYVETELEKFKKVFRRSSSNIAKTVSKKAAQYVDEGEALAIKRDLESMFDDIFATFPDNLRHTGR